MSDKDVEVSVFDDSLVIKGEKKEEKEEKDKNCWHTERCYGSFYRAIPLPKDVDSEKTDASFKKGVLHVTIPKTKEAADSSKKISIKTE
jgi:HSP20 family protein